MAHLELVHRAPPAGAESEARPDRVVVAHLIDDGARVLHVGCGDGALMRLLARECKARVRGLEIEPARVRACVNRGLAAVQGDAQRDLSEFPSGSFDIVVLGRLLQRLPHRTGLLKQAARIAPRVIVTLRNAAHWRARAKLALQGRAAERDGAQFSCSVRDFAEFARSCGLTIETAVPLSRGRAGAPFAKTLWRANWFAEEAVFLLCA